MLINIGIVLTFKHTIESYICANIRIAYFARRASNGRGRKVKWKENVSFATNNKLAAQWFLNELNNKIIHNRSLLMKSWITVDYKLSNMDVIIIHMSVFSELNVN